jgi:hypothetical protein
VNDEDAPLPGAPSDEVGRTVRCGMCGRVLRTAVARRRGVGAECWGKTHSRPAVVRTPGRFDVEQDTLPGA